MKKNKIFFGLTILVLLFVISTNVKAQNTWLSGQMPGDAGTGSEGIYNTYVGIYSGYLVKGDYNTFIGFGAGKNGGEAHSTIILGARNEYCYGLSTSTLIGNYNTGIKGQESIILGSSNYELEFNSNIRGIGSIMLGNGNYGLELNSNLFIGHNGDPLIFGDFTPGSEYVSIGGDLSNSGNFQTTGYITTGRQGVTGTYSSTQVQGIWSIGSAYKVNTSANDFGTQYGMVYAHTNAGTSGSKKPITGWGHQILFTTGGTRMAAISLSSGHGYFAGNVGIGTTVPPSGYKLAVAGNILAHEIKVSAAGNLPWPDFVFHDEYELKPLSEVEEYVQENHHLPNIPSEQEVKEDGISLGEMNAKLLQKIEELTLYIIEQDKRLSDIESKIN